MLVYLLTNTVNCKCYVGQTTKNCLSRRWNTTFTNVRGNRHFQSALKKYGHQAFTREILNRCSTREETDWLEPLWIAVLDTCNPAHGYNIERGGRKLLGRSISRPQTAETKKKISAAMKRYWQSVTPEMRLTFSETVRRTW